VNKLLIVETLEMCRNYLKTIKSGTLLWFWATESSRWCCTFSAIYDRVEATGLMMHITCVI